MRIEEIDEPVEVIALFQTGKLSPLKFRWRDRVYRIQKINGGWNSDIGAVRMHHFAVMSDGPDVFELVYNERAHDWKINRISVS
jgi:hypothetical protein